MAETFLQPWPMKSYWDWIDEPVPEVKWLLYGLLPLGAIGWISGPPKRGYKTFLAMVIAEALTLNRPLGQFIKPAAAVNVLLVEEEGTNIDTKHRMRKVELGNWGVDRWSEKVNPYVGALTVAHHIGFRLDDKAHVKRLEALIKKYDYKLVILDALTYMHMGDENNKLEMMKAITGIMRLRDNTGATILSVVHTRKNSVSETDHPDDELRGSSLLRDVYDVHLACRRIKETKELMLHALYRDKRPKKYDLNWDIDDCIEDPEEDKEGFILCSTLRCNHKARFSMEPRGKHALIKTLYQQNILGVMVYGQPYTIKEFRAMLGPDDFSEARTREIKLSMFQLGLLMSAPQGGGVMLPGGDKI